MNIGRIAPSNIKQAKKILKDVGVLPKAKNVQPKKGGIIG